MPFAAFRAPPSARPPPPCAAAARGCPPGSPGAGRRGRGPGAMPIALRHRLVSQPAPRPRSRARPSGRAGGEPPPAALLSARRRPTTGPPSRDTALAGLRAPAKCAASGPARRGRHPVRAPTPRSSGCRRSRRCTRTSGPSAGGGSPATPACGSSVRVARGAALGPSVPVPSGYAVASLTPLSAQVAWAVAGLPSAADAEVGHTAARSATGCRAPGPGCGARRRALPPIAAGPLAHGLQP